MKKQMIHYFLFSAFVLMVVNNCEAMPGEENSRKQAAFGVVSNFLAKVWSDDKWTWEDEGQLIEIGSSGWGLYYQAGLLSDKPTIFRGFYPKGKPKCAVYGNLLRMNRKLFESDGIRYSVHSSEPVMQYSPMLNGNGIVSVIWGPSYADERAYCTNSIQSKTIVFYIMSYEKDKICIERSTVNGVPILYLLGFYYEGDFPVPKLERKSFDALMKRCGY